VEALDQRLRTRIGLRVQKLVRMPVSGKESFEPQHVAVVGTADDYRPACTRLDQANAAQDKGAHDALAQFGLFHQKIPQPARRDDKCQDGLLGAGIDQGRAAR